MNIAINNYGGWVKPYPSTGNSQSLVKLIGWASAAVIAALAASGTGSELQPGKLQERVTHPNSLGIDIVDATAERTPMEDLQRIRQVLTPAISDLAVSLGVTRQSVYNWLNGDPVAVENAAKLRDLAQAADYLVTEGVTISSSLLKRQISNGMTLFQVVQAGESARDAASILVQILRREDAQRVRVSARLAGRRSTPATEDFDLPAANDPT
jgi:transcriptional regulator with XRE-family HTH domain